MRTAARRRTTWAIAASALLHLAVGIVILLQRPVLVEPVWERGPPEPVIPVLITPRTPPATSGKAARPTPIRLHRRPQPNLPPDAPTAPIAPPLPVSPAPSGQSQAHGPVALHPSPLPAGPTGDVRTALRQGAPGCANADAVGLTRAERDLCDEKFGKGAEDAAFAGLGLNGEKQRLLEAAGGRKDADRKYRETTPVARPVPPGIGATAEDLAAGLGSDRPAAKAPPF